MNLLKQQVLKSVAKKDFAAKQATPNQAQVHLRV